MQDTTAQTGWKPGKFGIMGSLSSTVADFFASNWKAIQDSYEAADTPDELLEALVRDFEFKAEDATDAKGTVYHNAYRQIQTRGNNVARLSVTLDSKGNLSWQVKEFWQ